MDAGFPLETIQSYPRAAEQNKLSHRLAVDGRDRFLLCCAPELTEWNPPAPPSCRAREDPLLRCPCPRNLLCPIARRPGRAWWPAPAEPRNRVVPGRPPFLRNAGRDGAADPVLSGKARKICKCDDFRDRVRHP